MRLLRIVVEGLLVAFLAALTLYFLRHHLEGGLVAGIFVCLVGIGIITWFERRHSTQSTLDNLGPGDGRGAADGSGYGYGGGTWSGGPPSGSIIAGGGITAGGDISALGDITADVGRETSVAEPFSVDHTRIAMPPPPSFAAEERSYKRILRDYDGTPEAIEAVDEWIAEVTAKLEQWNPRNARAFEAGSIFDNLVGAAASLTGDGHHDDDEHLQSLSVHYLRLHRIIDDE